MSVARAGVFRVSRGRREACCFLSFLIAFGRTPRIDLIRARRSASAFPVYIGTRFGPPNGLDDGRYSASPLTCGIIIRCFSKIRMPDRTAVRPWLDQCARHQFLRANKPSSLSIEHWWNQERWERKRKCVVASVLVFGVHASCVSSAFFRCAISVIRGEE